MYWAAAPIGQSGAGVSSSGAGVFGSTLPETEVVGGASDDLGAGTFGGGGSSIGLPLVPFRGFCFGVGLPDLSCPVTFCVSLERRLTSPANMTLTLWRWPFLPTTTSPCTYWFILLAAPAEIAARRSNVAIFFIGLQPELNVKLTSASNWPGSAAP